MFVLGDATDVPASKAGSVTHFEGEVLAGNVAASWPASRSTPPSTGTPTASSRPASAKALLIDFNYDTEPLPGHYPGPVGLPLLRESRLNHLGKLMFQWVYWHALLPGRDIPGISSAMPTGARTAASPAGHAMIPIRRTDHATATYAGHDVTSTTKASSPTRTSGPRRWPRRSPAEGIAELTPRHWRVIRFMRAEYLAKGTGPTVRVARQDLRRVDQGALPALPQGAGQARRQDRRHPQAPRLHLMHDERTMTHGQPPSRRSRSSSRRAPSRASTPA